MNLRKLTGAAVAAVLALPMFASHATAYELVIPTLDYRTGPYAPNGIPLANAYSDYINLLNERDGGIEGVGLVGQTEGIGDQYFLLVGDTVLEQT